MKLQIAVKIEVASDSVGDNKFSQSKKKNVYEDLNKVSTRFTLEIGYGDQSLKWLTSAVQQRYALTKQPGGRYRAREDNKSPAGFFTPSRVFVVYKDTVSETNEEGKENNLIELKDPKIRLRDIFDDGMTALVVLKEHLQICPEDGSVMVTEFEKETYYQGEASQMRDEQIEERHLYENKCYEYLTKFGLSASKIAVLPTSSSLHIVKEDDDKYMNDTKDQYISQRKASIQMRVLITGNVESPAEIKAALNYDWPNINITEISLFGTNEVEVDNIRCILAKYFREINEIFLYYSGPSNLKTESGLSFPEFARIAHLLYSTDTENALRRGGANESKDEIGLHSFNDCDSLMKLFLEALGHKNVSYMNSINNYLMNRGQFISGLLRILSYHHYSQKNLSNNSGNIHYISDLAETLFSALVKSHNLIRLKQLTPQELDNIIEEELKEEVNDEGKDEYKVDLEEKEKEKKEIFDAMMKGESEKYFERKKYSPEKHFTSDIIGASYLKYLLPIVENNRSHLMRIFTYIIKVYESKRQEELERIKRDRTELPKPDPFVTSPYHKHNMSLRTFLEVCLDTNAVYVDKKKTLLGPGANSMVEDLQMSERKRNLQEVRGIYQLALKENVDISGNDFEAHGFCFADFCQCICRMAAISAILREARLRKSKEEEEVLKAKKGKRGKTPAEGKMDDDEEENYKIKEFVAKQKVLLEDKALYTKPETKMQLALASLLDMNLQ